MEPFELQSLTGVVHRVVNDGIYTNDVYRPFPTPINDVVLKAGTSSSGMFLFFIVNQKLFFGEVGGDLIEVEEIRIDEEFVDAIFTIEESFLLSLSASNALYIFNVKPFFLIQNFFLNSQIRPVSFSYIDLQKLINVNYEDESTLSFSLPTPIISNEEQILIDPIQLPNIMDGEQEPPPPQELIQPAPFVTPVFPTYAHYVRHLCDIHKSRKEQIMRREQNLIEEINKCEQRCDKCSSRIRESIQKTQELAKRLIRLIAVLDSRDMLKDEKKRLKKYMSKIDDFMCVDDVSTDEVEAMIQSLDFDQRLKKLSDAIHPPRKQAVFYL
ncbi:hypothetical protein GPJ56_009645 [Histomonas meleagridis]|uniref:uncharacterized protein n=1 Tax=Histomonas meleagridis TaxID=135588 RepID=UPI00355AC67E|nr:hypothetical protein GPJ56_009645 [Histomonas meleagridis]KAH0804384.1 hypothetical protein GO595_003214 [Histomonas meleagridis]